MKNITFTIICFLILHLSCYSASSFSFPKRVPILFDSIPASDTPTFKKVEKEAYFPGGEKAWIKFLRKRLDPDVPIRLNAPPGSYTVVIQFIVNKDGSLDILPLTNFGYGMEDEIVRVMSKAPSWIPAEQNGKPVRAYRKQPFTFSVPEKRKRTKE